MQVMRPAELYFREEVKVEELALEGIKLKKDDVYVETLGKGLMDFFSLFMD